MFMAYIFQRMQLFEGFEDRNETNSSKNFANSIGNCKKYISNRSMEITKYDNNINIEIVEIITIIREKN